MRALLLKICLGFIDRTLRLLDLRLRLLERLLQIPGIHASDHLSRGDHIADVGVELGDPARKFRVDIDFIGLQPAIAPTYAGGQLRLRVLPPIETSSPCREKNGKKPDREP